MIGVYLSMMDSMMDLDSILLVRIKNYTYIIHKNYIYVISFALGISFSYCLVLVIRKLLSEVENRWYRRIRKRRAQVTSRTRGGALTPEQALEECLAESNTYESIDPDLNKLILSMVKGTARDGLIVISKQVYILAKILASKQLANLNLRAIGIEVHAQNLPAIIRTSKNIFRKSFNTGALILSTSLTGIAGLVTVIMFLSAINTGLDIRLRQQCSNEVVPIQPNPIELVQPNQANQVIYLDPQVSRASRVIVTDHEELVVVENTKPLSEYVVITQSDNGISVNIDKENMPSSTVSKVKTQTVDDVQRHDDSESRRDLQAISESRKPKRRPKKNVPLSQRTQTLAGLKKADAEKASQDLNKQQDDIIEDDFIERVWNNLNE